MNLQNIVCATTLLASAAAFAAVDSSSTQTLKLNLKEPAMNEQIDDCQLLGYLGDVNVDFNGTKATIRDSLDDISLNYDTQTNTFEGAIHNVKDDEVGNTLFSLNVESQTLKIQSSSGLECHTAVQFANAMSAKKVLDTAKKITAKK